MNFVTKLFQIVIFIGIYPNVFGTDVLPTNCVEDQLLDLLRNWRNGNALPLPLPLLDNINIKPFVGEYEGYGIKVAFSTGNLKLTGVSNFYVKELLVSKGKLLTAAGSVQFPTLTLTSDNYNLKGKAYVLYSLKGSGFMNVTFQDVVLTFGMSLVPNLNSIVESIQIKDIKLDYSVKAVYVNLADSSWPINKVLNSQGLNIIESYHSTIVNEATAGLKSSLNMYLGAVAPQELTNVLVAYC